MKGLVVRGLAIASSAALLVGLAACSSTPKEPDKPYVAPQGVTDTEISFGSHQPLTGPAASGYSKIAPATKAYFDMINDNGGVYGRKIRYNYIDDTYNPSTTQTVVRKLVEEDKVFAILNGLGTPTHTGVLDYLKDKQIPDLFVASGATTWNQPSKYPGTFALQPDYTTEGKIIGQYIKNNFAGKKVCHFGQDDDFGRDALIGLEKGLGSSVVAKQTYVTSNQAIGPQISALKDAGCDVVVLATVPGFTALTLGTAARIAFKPQFVASGVGGGYLNLSTTLGANKGLLEGYISTGYLPAEQDTNNAWNKLFSGINDKYNAGVPFDGYVAYGMNVGYVTVQALLAAGKNITTESLIKGIQDKGSTWKGAAFVPLGYSKDSHGGYTGVRMTKITGDKGDYFGPTYVTDPGTGPIKEYTEAPSNPPANGIPTA